MAYVEEGKAHYELLKCLTPQRSQAKRMGWQWGWDGLTPDTATSQGVLVVPRLHSLEISPLWYAGSAKCSHHVCPISCLCLGASRAPSTFFRI